MERCRHSRHAGHGGQRRSQRKIELANVYVTLENWFSKHFLSLLIFGFAILLAMLLCAATYIAFGVMYPAEMNAMERAEQDRLAAAQVEAMHRDADGLNTIFYKLAMPSPTGDGSGLLRHLETIERNVARTTAVGAASRYARQWADVQRTAADFIAEGRHVLGPSETTNAVLFARHDALTDALATLGTALFEDQNRAQKADVETSSRRVRMTASLLGLTLLVAMAVAVVAIHVTRRVVTHAQWQAAELERLSSRTMSELDALSQKLSRELHDHFGQTLSAIEANLVAIQNRRTFDNGRIEDCLGLTKDAIGNVREVSQLLRPSMLDDFGLDASLQWLAEGFAERTGIAVSYQSDFKERLAHDAETQVFRIAQEALTNIGRHAKATEVIIRMQPAHDRLRLLVSDNGVGIGDGRREGGLGLAGMRARARTARGHVVIGTGSGGKGVSIVLEVPMEKAAV